ncbi:L-lactate dehydrogenase [Lachnospiraceae bacterium NSJ-143]|nr:L-lactate dehydrogenase [Lachnospiraceae bacterium NSJ-143]
MTIKPRKAVIIGAGHVGSHVGSSLVLREVIDELVFIDIDEKKAAAHALDLNDSVSALSTNITVKTGGYNECANADVVVMAVGTQPVPGKKRLQMFDETIEMLQDVVPKLKASGFNGIVVSISNPADIVADYIRKRLGLPESHVFSTGTTLDTCRLKRILSEKTGYNRNSIQAYCMGEHGDSSMVPFSHVSFGGKSFEDMKNDFPDTFGKMDTQEIMACVRQGGFDIVNGKSCTEFGIGLAACEIVKAVLRDEKRVMPVSALLNGQYGQYGVSAGVPCVIGKDGVEEIIEISLTPEEKALFDHSCGVIRGYIEKADNRD